jgi:hypothetical protein
MDNTETTFLWEDANTTLPPTNNQTSEYILFTIADEVHCGYLDYAGCFNTVTEYPVRRIGIAPFQPAGETFSDEWHSNLDNEDFALVEKWVYLKDTYPKLERIKDKLIYLWGIKLHSDEEISKALVQRVISLVTELYELDKLNFKAPKINSASKSLTLKWLGKNDRVVKIIFTLCQDYLVCDGNNITHEFFPFTIDKVVEWLAWLDK